MPAPRKYPLPEMQVGEERILTTPQRCFSKYAHKRGLELGRKFRTFQVGDAVRVKRIA